jgi:hypothetical protein
VRCPVGGALPFSVPCAREYASALVPEGGVLRVRRGKHLARARRVPSRKTALEQTASYEATSFSRGRVWPRKGKSSRPKATPTSNSGTIVSARKVHVENVRLFSIAGSPLQRRGSAPNTGLQPTAYTRREQRYLAWVSCQLVSVPGL